MKICCHRCEWSSIIEKGNSYLWQSCTQIKRYCIMNVSLYFPFRSRYPKHIHSMHSTWPQCFIMFINIRCMINIYINIYNTEKYLYPDLFPWFMLAPFAAFPPGHLTVGAHQTDASPHQMCNPRISQGSSFDPELDLTNTTIPTQQLAHKRIRLWAQGQYHIQTLYESVSKMLCLNRWSVVPLTCRISRYQLMISRWSNFGVPPNTQQPTGLQFDGIPKPCASNWC